MNASTGQRARPRYRLAAETPEVQRNYWLCVANGGVTGMGQAFFAWETVMAGLVFTLTGSPLLVGLWASVATIGWQWPQLIVGSVIEHQPRKMPVYNLTVAIRLCGIAGMFGALLALHHEPLTLYWTMLAFLILFSTGGGICVVPFFDIVAKTIPHEHRSMLFAWRRALTGALGFATGAIVYFILSRESGLLFPHNYALLLALGFLVNAAGYAAFMAIREPVDTHNPPKVSFWRFLRRGPALFRNDLDFRRYYLFKLCLALGSMSQVLYVPFVISQFDAPLDRTGWFAAIVALIGGLATLAWGRLAGAQGEVRLLQWATGLLILAPLTALSMALASGALAQAIALLYLPLAFFLFGCTTAALAGTEVGGSVYMLSLPPPDRRATYFAFMNTLSAPFTLLPLAAGWLAMQASYGLVFGLSATAASVAVLLALRLRDRSASSPPSTEP